MAELTRRYIVMQMATEGPFDLREPDGVFVLKPWKDPAALRALEAYRDHCYPALAAELSAWIDAIGAGPVMRGGVGARNEEFLVARVAESRPGLDPSPPGSKRVRSPTGRNRARRGAATRPARRKKARKRGSRP